MSSTQKSKRTSPIWKPTKEEFQKLVNESSTYTEILKKIGLGTNGANPNTLKQRFQEDNTDLTLLNKNREVYMSNHSSKALKPDSEVFIENSSYSGGAGLKKRLINKGRTYRCEECGNKGEHMGKKLVLQLDHQNGIRNDHRVENLRFLCPNCHTQTDTYTGKNNIVKKEPYFPSLWHTKKISLCPLCSGEKSKQASLCNKCYSSDVNSDNRKKARESHESREYKSKYKITWPPIQELIKTLEKSNFVQVAKELKVSDNAIRKFLIRNGYDPKTLKPASSNN